MDLEAVMSEIATQLKTIDGLRVYPYAPDDLAAPAALIISPAAYDFDATYGRGQDSISLPVLLLVSKVDDRNSWKQLAAYCSGSGPKAVKQVVEAGAYTAFDFAHVQSVEFDAVQWAGATYISAKFAVDIEGPGTP